MYTVEEMVELKKKYGLSYEFISERSGVSLSTVQKVLGGINKNPRRNTLESLSAFFEQYGKPRFVYSTRDDKPDIDQLREEAPYYTKGSSAIKNDFGSGSADIYTQSGYTYEDYYRLELPEGKRVEVIDGVIYDMSAPSVLHQLIMMEVSLAFANYIKKNKGKCTAVVSPVDVRLEYDKGDMTVVQPDLIVVCDREKFSDIRAVKGAPDFVLEVLSPSTRKRDLNIKKKKYQENGVREYWIADPESRVVIKTVFEGEERSTMYTFEDDIPVYIYDGKLVVTLRDLEF